MYGFESFPFAQKKNVPAILLKYISAETEKWMER